MLDHMSRPFWILLAVSISLTSDGILCWVIYREARIKDGETSALWYLLTISLAMMALIPLFELARRGRLPERILAGVLASIPVAWLGWLGCCAYTASR